MTDDRFFQRSGPFSLGEIALRAGAQLSPQAPADMMVRGVAPLEKAASDELSVFSDVRHADEFACGHAGAIITSAKLADYPHNGAWLLIARDPRFAFATIGLLFHPRHVAEPGIHNSAQIDPSASLGAGCQIDSGVVIGAHARLGPGCHVAANAVIGPAVEIGEGSVVGSNASISHALIGAGVRIGSGVVIGGEGFGVMAGPRGLMCSAQLGRAIVGDGVRIGSNCTVDRGAADDTVIGAGTMLDNLVHIAHNVRIGTNCVFAGQTGIAGSTTIGDNVMVGGQAAISDHLVVGSNARIAGRSAVMRDVGEGQAVAGYPAIPVRQWHRQTVTMAKSIRKSITEA